MADITMSVDDTLELDYLIKNINPSSNINIDLDSSNYNLSGIQTNTGIFDPQVADTYTITINNRSIVVEVRESDSKILIDDFEWGGSISNRYSGSTNSFNITKNKPYKDTYGLETSTGTTDSIGSTPGDGLNYYPRRGDIIQVHFYAKGNNSRPGVLFGATDDNTQFGRFLENGYYFEWKGNGWSGQEGDLILGKQKDGNQSDIDRDTDTYSKTVSGEWFRLVIDFSDPIIVKLYNSNNNLKSRLKGSDNKINGRAFGFFADNNNEYYDYAMKIE